MNESDEHHTPVVEALDSFASLNLDSRLIKALGDLDWKTPTPVQSSALPLALSGKDVLIQATTGSGKTAVFLLPILHGLLKTKALGKTTSYYPYAVVLAPSKELAEQTAKVCRKLCKYCRNAVNCVVPDPADVDNKIFSIFELRIPDILISTPSLVQKCLQMYSSKFLRKAKVFVADEADVLFRYGYKGQIQTIIDHMKSFQSIVVSATLSKHLAIFKTLLPKNLAIVRIMNQVLPDKDQLKQFYIRFTDNAKKFAILLALLNFNIIKGNCLIFCSSRRSAYKVKLFLDCFKYNSRVINEKLPFNSRKNTIDEFNAGKFRIIIATDDALKPFNEESEVDSEFTVSRGMDFQDIPVVVNFDFPQDHEKYIHRAGRTARGVKKGSVLSFVGDLRHEKLCFKKLQRKLFPGSKEKAIEAYPLNIHKASKLLFYRVNSAMSRITRNVVIKAEQQELQKELLRSKNLQFHFKRNPIDFAAVLKRTKYSTAVTHLRGIEDLPDYLRHSDLPTEEIGARDDISERFERKKDGNERSGKGADATGNGNRKRRNMSSEMNDYYKNTGLVKTGPEKKKAKRDVENGFKNKKKKFQKNKKDGLNAPVD